MAEQNYYQTLGINRDASEADIKKAYRHLARKLHPDVNPGDKNAEERFKNIQTAYQVLKDPEKRKLYDRFGFYREGMKDQAGQGFSGGFRPGAQGGGFEGFEGFDFSQFTSQPGGGGGGGRQSGHFRDIFSDLFSGFRGGGGQSGGFRPRPGKGADVESRIRISFMDAVRGAQRSINVSRQVNGQGTAQRTERFKVNIPAGVSDGSRIRLAGKGSPGPDKGPAGDLFLRVEVERHPYFGREGNNITLQLPLTFEEAALGTKVEVPTIDGPTTMKIPPGTQGGQKLRLRGKGVPS
ncbi:MAG TPA: DnaJ C-terminal domain-containing protein, partial [Acidobacteriota bacterium]|nr:DnaJ C-terminal domain-containing protein [Acidobacteriota bacterium]